MEVAHFRLSCSVPDSSAEPGRNEWDLSSTRVWEPIPDLFLSYALLEIYFSENL
jgi:hypothetical protein